MKRFSLCFGIFMSMLLLLSCSNDTEISKSDLMGTWKIHRLTKDIIDVVVEFEKGNDCSVKYTRKKGTIPNGNTAWETLSYTAIYNMSGSKIEIDCYLAGIVYDVEILKRNGDEVEVKIKGGQNTYKATAEKQEVSITEDVNDWNDGGEHESDFVEQ